MEQIVLPLDFAGMGQGEHLVAGDSNRAALDAIARWRDWPFLTAILTGPPRAGKTTILRWFEQRTGGEGIDDAERAGDEALFHAWNRAQQGGRPLLLTSRFVPADWSVALVDLRSRLAGVLLLSLGPPDDGLLTGLIEELARRRGLAIAPEALAYALRRMRRSHAGAEQLVAALTKTVRGGVASLPVMRDALETTG